MSEPAAPASHGGSPFPILIGCALAGAGTMVVELAAVRLVAPWFGSSHVVWSNVIGVVLLALTLGYVLGGRLATGKYPTRSMGLSLGAAALLVACLPFLSQGICRFFMPQGVALDQALNLFTWGSLAASLLLFLPPALLLGSVSPLATEALYRLQGLSPGQAGGRVLATATLGSLVGVFSTSHFLLPQLGVRLTFVLAAALLMTGATILLLRSGPGPRSLLIWLPLMVPALFDSPTVALAAQDTLLGELESPYQTIRVLKTGNGPSESRRLVVNEALDSFQSVWQPEIGLLGAGHYYDLFSLPLGMQEPPDTWELLILGLGAGTAVRVLEGVMAENTSLVWTGVEIDPGILQIGKMHMGLEAFEPNQILSGWDSRAALGSLLGPYDQIILDSYANNMEIPFHLATIEFFELALSKLKVGGWLSLNAAGFGMDDPLIQTLAATMAQAAKQVALTIEVPFSRNCVILVRRGAQVPELTKPATQGAHQAVANLMRSLGVPGTLCRTSPGQGPRPLTDNRAPLEKMQRASIARGRQRWARGKSL